MTKILDILPYDEYELSRWIFFEYIHNNPKYQSTKNNQVQEIANSLINILSDYDYEVFQEDNPLIELEAFLRSSIELLLEKGVTEENISTLGKQLEIIMENLSCPRIIKDYQDAKPFIEDIIKKSLTTEQIEGLSPLETEALKRTIFCYMDEYGRIHKEKEKVDNLYEQLTQNKSKIINI